MPSTNSTLSTIPERWAVVIGCEGYTSLPALPGAAADANRVADALRGADYTRVFCLTDVALDASGASKPELFYPTRANLVERLNRFLQPGRLRAEDTLLCYFTGHGLRLADGDYLAPLGLRAGPAEQLTAGDLVSVSGLVKLLTGTGAGQVGGTPVPGQQELTPRRIYPNPSNHKVIFTKGVLTIQAVHVSLPT